jgi:hypothetical protein
MLSHHLMLLLLWDAAATTSQINTTDLTDSGINNSTPFLPGTTKPTPAPTSLNDVIADLTEKQAAAANDNSVVLYACLVALFVAVGFMVMVPLQRYCWSYPIQTGGPAIPLLSTEKACAWFCGWIPELYKISDDEVYKAGG